MPIPYPDNLTPESGVLVHISINEYWYSVLMGFAGNALRREEWEVTDSQWDEIQQAILTMLTLGSEGGTMGFVKDVRLNENGELEKTFDGENWLSAGDIDIILSASAASLPSDNPPTADIVNDVLELGIPAGQQGAAGTDGQGIADVEVYTLPAGAEAEVSYADGVLTLGIPRGDAGQAGASGANAEYVLPDVLEQDRYCSAAWVLARILADSLQDVIELIDVVETQTAETTEWLGDILSSFVPPLDFLGGTIEYIHEGITQPVVDWIRTNVKDDQAIALAANQLFCAMLDSNGDDLWEYVDWLEALPEFDFDVSDPLQMNWNNFKAWADFAFGVFDGSACGWIILAWGNLVSQVLGALGGVDTWTKAVAKAANTADFRASEMCDECPEDTWESIIELADSDGDFAYSTSPAFGTWVSGQGWKTTTGVYSGNNRRALFLMWTLPETIDISEAVWTFDYTVGSNPQAGYNAYTVGKAGDGWASEQQNTVTNGTPKVITTGAKTGVTNLVFSAQTYVHPTATVYDGECRFYRLKLKGIGEKPAWLP